MEYKEQLNIYTKELEECVDIIISERKRYEEIKTNINKLMDTISIVSNKYSDGSFKVEYSVNYSDKEIADKIIKIVSDVSGMSEKSILSSNRKKEYIIYRHIMSYLIKENTAMTLSQVGERIGKPKPKTHATVLNGIKQVKNSYWNANKHKHYNEIYNECEKVKGKMITEL